MSKDSKNKEKINEVTKVITSEEQAVASRVEQAEPYWETITEESMCDFSLSKSVYELPPPAKELQDAKKFAFRVFENRPTRIDEVRKWPVPQRWELCTRTTAPFLKGYFDPGHGAVQLADQLLFMKPWHHHVMVQEKKNMVRTNREKSQTLAGKDGEITDKAEYFSGPQHRIGDSDVIMASETTMEE